MKYFDVKKMCTDAKIMLFTGNPWQYSDCHDVGRENKNNSAFYFRVLGLAISFQAI